MKEIPKKIYLQFKEDPHTEGFVNDTTWCEDKIHDNDIEYVAASELAELEAQVAIYHDYLKRNGYGIQLHDIEKEKAKAKEVE